MSISNIEVAERFVAAGGGGGRNPTGKVAEKSNFAQTCNLLSQYLKEKRNFGDLPRGMSGIFFESKGRGEAIPAANLLPTAACAGETSPALKPLAFFPQVAGFPSSDPRSFAVNKSDIRIPADAMPETAQMTIFYAGEVMVYDDFPAERVKEMMALAAQGSPQNPVCHFSSPALAAPDVTLNPSRHAVVAPKVASEPRHVLAQECPETSTQPIGPVDMPIARRNSLHRFLAKRKDRSTARAPYQVTKPFAGTPRGEESNSLAGMEAQSSEHLELKL